MHRSSLAIAALATLTLALGDGCDGRGDYRAQTTSRAPGAGPASAEAVVERFNELCTRAPVVDPAAIVGLLHAENEREKRIVAAMRESIPLLELDQALWDRFGAGITPGQAAPPLAPIREPARLTTSIGHRATADYTRADGTRGKLFLVRADGAWRLSAHSFDRMTAADGDGDPLEERERMNRYLAPHAPAITARVREGHFASTAEAGFALGQAVAADHPEVRARPGLMFGQ